MLDICVESHRLTAGLAEIPVSSAILVCSNGIAGRWQVRGVQLLMAPLSSALSIMHGEFCDAVKETLI